jgi:hypothetical protein
MKFVFKSEHEYGTTVEMTFEEEHLDEIEEMFKLFLRGSGFHIPDEDMYTKEESSDTSEECVPARDIKPWVGLSDEEVAIYSNRFNGINLVKVIEALVKERNT